MFSPSTLAVMRRSSIAAIATLVVAATFAVEGQAARDETPGAAVASTAGGETVLFPFDDRAIPWSYGLVYDLVQGRRRGIVLRPGESGPDSQHIINHGTVLRVADELRMWYLCAGEHDPPISIEAEDFEGETPSLDDDFNPRKAGDERTFRVCYATSRDGIHWERPSLGLVEYGGSKSNNLVDFLGSIRVVNLRVIDDHEDPDPARRFKMAFQSHKYRSRLAFAWSADGLRWQEMPANPTNDHMVEISGLIRFDGVYYVNGHGGSPRPGPAAHAPRRMVTYASYDFENWTDATALSFERKGGEIPVPWRGNAGEQIHTGAALWNRGNVVLGFYGMWHGHPSDDRRMVTMDIGLIVSDDAIHFREPIENFRIVPGNEEGETVVHTFNPRTGGAGGGSLFGLALMQGQGWENLGDHTLYWYNVWSQGRVRLATWPRDRLGYFKVGTGLGSELEQKPHFISAPIDLIGAGQRVFVNADGLDADSQLTLEILDEQFRPLPGFTGENAVAVTEPGFRQPAQWRGKTVLESSDRPIRVRVNFEGNRPEDVRVFAVYVATE
jgi:hypothetical protein